MSDRVGDYIAGLFAREDDVLRSLREDADREGLPPISVPPETGRFLQFLLASIGAIVLAKTRWGYETFATGGNELAARYAGVPTRWVRMRAYLLSAF